ncbi:MAG: hypothetical protein ACKV19_22405, partial [Verrucomicrobiales bacterium]
MLSLSVLRLAAAFIRLPLASTARGFITGTLFGRALPIGGFAAAVGLFTLLAAAGIVLPLACFAGSFGTFLGLRHTGLFRGGLAPRFVFLLALFPFSRCLFVALA